MSELDDEDLKLFRRILQNWLYDGNNETIEEGGTGDSDTLALNVFEWARSILEAK